MRRFSFRSTPCGIFGFSSRNQDLTSLRSFYLFCLPQGAIENAKVAMRQTDRNEKKPLSSYLEAVFPFVPCACGACSFEPKPRFELGTPSLRVKCSTAELFRRFISEFGCKDSTFYYFFAIFRKKFLSPMLTFLVRLTALVIAYFTYGRYLERVAAIDPAHSVPSETLFDGVDYVPMPRWRVFSDPVAQHRRYGSDLRRDFGSGVRSRGFFCGSRWAASSWVRCTTSCRASCSCATTA